MLYNTQYAPPLMVQTMRPPNLQLGTPESLNFPLNGYVPQPLISPGFFLVKQPFSDQAPESDEKILELNQPNLPSLDAVHPE